MAATLGFFSAISVSAVLYQGVHLNHEVGRIPFQANIEKSRVIAGGAGSR
jgi:hypothetical protein